MHDETRGRDPLEYAAIGQYQTRGILGRGAMGTVYEGLHPALGKRVAIKRVRLPEAHDAEAQETLLRFRREAQAAARLDHPNIVGVFDYGETDNSAFIVMEFIDGTNLSQVLTQAEPMPLSEAVQVMQDILAGLAYSHARGVVHRDIKPANIMITSDKRAKIADFGIARLDDGAGLTLTGAMLGTPAYMSPEQFTGPAADHRTDIYSAGVVFYQMLTGERPFAGGSLSMVHYNVLNTTPPPPSNLAATVPAGLDDVVKRAMARRRDDRFASAAEFTQAITDALRPKRPIPPAAPDPQATLVLPQPLPHVHKSAATSRTKRGGIQPKIIAAIFVLLLMSGSVIAWYTLTQPAGQPSKSASSAPPAATLVKEVANPTPNPLPPGSTQEQQQSPSDASICSASVALQGPHPILDPSRAGPACEAALRQKPSDPQLNVLMANVRRFQDNNIPEAARLYRVAAEQGYAAGQSSLGVLYERGLGGLPKDQAEAARLFRLAANQGNAYAQYDLGLYYDRGLGGLPKDQAEAARLYRLAADQGNSYAQNELGIYYDLGLGGLPKDQAEAARLFRLAVGQGNAAAQTRLGLYYDRGLGGLPKDQAEAARLFRLAADQGNAAAQTSLGIYYDWGLGGLPKDQAEAARLYRLAADQGDAAAQYNLGCYYDQALGGLPTDKQKAARLFRLAADQGLDEARHALADYYDLGLGGVPKDPAEAARLRLPAPSH